MMPALRDKNGREINLGNVVDFSDGIDYGRGEVTTIRRNSTLIIAMGNWRERDGRLVFAHIAGAHCILSADRVAISGWNDPGNQFSWRDEE
jgi:hypothetical protein